MKEIGYLFGLFASLPLWLRVLIYCLLSALAVAVAGYLGRQTAIITLVVCVVLGILLLFYAWLVRWVRERKAAELRGELENIGARRLATDPEAQARLDRLRKAFETGVDRFQMFGKDLYELPWYLLVGEPAAGKTEAIRHSRVELPQDLQDREQGIGGTDDLNWWFTNYAVILDTDGGMIFSDAEAGTTPDWRAFSELLSKHRPNCPVNGVILAIPADSLLKDSQREIDRKAGALARHFDTLQFSLENRFPVFVLITKCDLLDGFLPFFGATEDPKAQQQMLGWSNPAPLEAPFRPELVEEYLGSVIQRLSRRRLTLMADPVPQQGAARRADEVDALFEFPESLRRLVSPLRRYLDNIFVAGQWSSRPLFLRGVYFTSAPGESVPSHAETAADASTGPWYREKSYFLRDVFLDKIFREDGLVTRVGNQALQRIRLLWFGAGILLLLVLLGSALYGYQQMLSTLAIQIGYWDRSTAGWHDGEFSPVVADGPNLSAPFVFKGNSPIGKGPREVRSENFKASNLTVIEFQQTLGHLTSVPFGIPWTFQPLTLVGTNPDSARFAAQRVIFEAGVVKPLLDAAREKMILNGAPPGAQPSQLSAADAEHQKTSEARALAELVRVEAAIVRRIDGRPLTSPGTTFIPTLLEYTTGASDDGSLVTLMNWTYSENPAGAGAWAPDWTSGGSSLETNRAIEIGLERLTSFAEKRLDKLDRNLQVLQQLADAAKTYSTAETRLAAAADIKADLSASESAVESAFEDLEAAKIQLEEKLTQVRSMGLFENGSETLVSAVNLLANGGDSHLGQVDNILTEAESVIPAPPVVDKNLPIPPAPPSEAPRYLIFKQIKERLTGVSSMISTRYHAVVTDKLIADYQALDDSVLAPYAGMPSYLWRWKSYEECAACAPELHFNQNMYLVDLRWQQLGALISALDEIQARMDKYTGGANQQFQGICHYFLQRGESIQINSFTAAYVQQAKDALLRVARFPLIWPPGPENEALDMNQMVAARGLLTAISLDLQADTFTALPDSAKRPVLDFSKKLLPLYTVMDALVKPDGKPTKVTVTLYNGQAQLQLSGPNYAPLPTPTPDATPPPRTLMNKLFFGLGYKAPPPPGPSATMSIKNWNAVELVGAGGGGVYPLDYQTDVLLGIYDVQDPFSFRVYHSLLADDGTEMVDGGKNWSSLRLIARLGGQPVGIGQDWRVALKPNEPNAIWVKFSFELPLPPMPWPTLDSIGLRPVPGP